MKLRCRFLDLSGRKIAHVQQYFYSYSCKEYKKRDCVKEFEYDFKNRKNHNSRGKLKKLLKSTNFPHTFEKLNFHDENTLKKRIKISESVRGEYQNLYVKS